MALLCKGPLRVWRRSFAADKTLNRQEFTSCRLVKFPQGTKKKRICFHRCVSFWSGRRGSTRCRVPGKAGAFPGQVPPGLKKSGLHPDFVVEVSSSRERNKKKRLTNWLDALVWSGRRGSNSLPPPWQGGALPDELLPRQRRLL